MALAPGTRLGPYAVVGPIGAGGMGEVYEARDTRVDRKVAIKVLPAEWAGDAERRERFEREARAIAALNHPNICTLYEFDRQDGLDFLVLEYLEGESLAERVNKGPLAVDQALRLAIQIADALDRAHREGITHRDLKPANVIITKAGAKLLDFGLAKLREPAPGSEGSTKLADGLTQQGAILGTFQYMAPEQLDGQDADARADIWAFGAVLHEMITGQKAFEGRSQASLIGAIMRAEPAPVSARQPASPPGLDHIVRTCLAKDPDDRWQSAGEVARNLRGLVTGASLATGVRQPARASRLRAALPWALAAAVVSVVATTLVLGWLAPAVDRPVSRFTIVPPAASLLEITNTHPDITISPDGRHLVYTATTRRHLYRRSLDQLDAVELMPRDEARSPFFSPDGAWVGFHEGTGEGSLKKVSIFGGPPILICAVSNTTGASWGENDLIVFGDTERGALFQVSAAGGQAQALTSPEPGTVHRWPEVLPGSQTVIFTELRAQADVEAASLHAFDLRTKAITPLGLSGTHARYVSTGHLIYGVSDGSLRAVRFDPKSLVVAGTPVPVIGNVGVKRSGAANFAISRSGTIAYVDAPGGGQKDVLVWVDRHGSETPLGTEPQPYLYPRVSPDDTRIAVTVRVGLGSIWIWDIRRRSLSPLSTSKGPEIGAVWMPGSREVLYTTPLSLGSRVYRRMADGTGQPSVILENQNSLVSPESVDPHGREVVARKGDFRAVDLLRIPLDGAPGEAKTLFGPPHAERNGSISADGKWLAFESDSSGRIEVYVHSFPDVDRVRLPISSSGGRHPLWSFDGRELYYVSGDQLMAVPMTTTPKLEAGVAKPLFSLAGYRVAPAGYPGRMFDIAPDGTRFVMVKRGTDTAAAPVGVTLVLNWTQELERLAPRR